MAQKFTIPLLARTERKEKHQWSKTSRETRRPLNLGTLLSLLQLLQPSSLLLLSLLLSTFSRKSQQHERSFLSPFLFFTFFFSFFSPSFVLPLSKWRTFGTKEKLPSKVTTTLRALSSRKDYETLLKELWIYADSFGWLQEDEQKGFLDFS